MLLRLVCGLRWWPKLWKFSTLTLQRVYAVPLQSFQISASGLYARGIAFLQIHGVHYRVQSDVGDMPLVMKCRTSRSFRILGTKSLVLWYAFSESNICPHVRMPAVFRTEYYFLKQKISSKKKIKFLPLCRDAFKYIYIIEKSRNSFNGGSCETFLVSHSESLDIFPKQLYSLFEKNVQWLTGHFSQTVVLSLSIHMLLMGSTAYESSEIMSPLHVQYCKWNWLTDTY